MKAIVCGGGIGGLATAIALRRVGVDAVVYERADAIREVGAGITMWSNAMKALRVLGVDGAVIERGDVLLHATTMEDDGTPINEADFKELGDRHGAPSVCVHRGDLQRALFDALPREVIKTGRAVARIEQDDQSATVIFDDGSRDRGDLVIGADGVRSIVREAIVPGVKPRYAGYTSWRGIAPNDNGAALDARSTVRFVVGSGVQAAIFRCGLGRLYWFVTANVEAGRRDPPGGHREAALSTISSWKAGGPFRHVMGGTPEDAIVRADIHELAPLPRISVGRVTLLGDAAHATTPNLGQGGGMALEDSVVLAACMRDQPDVVRALAAYESARRDRTRFIVKQSHSLGAVLQWQNPLAVIVRDAFMKTKMSDRQSRALFDELLSWQPPPL